MPAPEPEQRDAARSATSASVASTRALEEAHALVEEAEALEPVAHEVEVGLQIRHRLVDGLRLLGRRRVSTGTVGDPDLALRQLVRVEVPAHEDARRRRGRCRTRRGRRGSPSTCIDAEAALEVVEPVPADRRVREEAVLAVDRRVRAGTTTAEQAAGTRPVVLGPGRELGPPRLARRSSRTSRGTSSRTSFSR